MKASVPQIHTTCKEAYTRRCSMGQCRISILPPMAITTLDSNGYWRAKKPAGTSPLLVFVNSKSGDTQVTTEMVSTTGAAILVIRYP